MGIEKNILQVIRAGETFLCTSHIRADGDGLGSALAFDKLLRKLGKRSHVVCDKGAIPEYSFLPGADKVGSAAKDVRSNYDAVFSFDCANFERLGCVGESLPRGVTIVNIDHHISNERFGAVNWIDDTFASTTEMVFTFAKAAKIRIDRPMAVCLYVGLVTDTGNFAFANTTVRSHHIAGELLKCGVRPSDISNMLYRQRTPGELKLFAKCIENLQLSKDGSIGWVRLTEGMMRECGHWPEETQMYVNVIKSLKTVKVAVLLRQMDSQVKVSFRTSEGIDGSKLAGLWGGGGHKRASGCTIDGPIEDVEKEVVRKTGEFLTKCRVQNAEGRIRKAKADSG